MLPDGGTDPIMTPVMGAWRARRASHSVLERPWALGKLLLRLVIGFFEGSAAVRSASALRWANSASSSSRGDLAFCSRAAPARRRACSAWVRAARARMASASAAATHRHLDFQGLDLLLRVQIR